MIEFFLHIDDNKKVTNEQVVDKNFQLLTPGRWFVQMKKDNKRTLPMNSYLHAVLIPEFRKALNEVGYGGIKTDAQAKLIMKNMFLKSQIVNENTGEVLEFAKDTHDLTTIEMSILFEEVIRFTAENMNYVIPFPNEQLKIV